jgi:hypothetical protein
VSIWEYIAGHKIAERSTGKGLRLRALHKGRRLVIFLRPGRDVIPANTIIERQVRADAIAVLREEVAICSALVESRRRLLRIEVRQSQQEVSVVVSGGLVARRKERISPVGNKIWSLLYAIPDVASSELEGVVASRARERVGQVVVAVDLRERERVGPDGEAVEEKTFDSGLRLETLNDALTACLNALIGKRDAYSAFGFANVVVQACDAEADLVDRLRAKCMDVAEDERLVDTEGCGVVSKAVAGKRGTAQPARIRVVEVVAVVEVVDRRRTEAR